MRYSRLEQNEIIKPKKNYNRVYIIFFVFIALAVAIYLIGVDNITEAISGALKIGNDTTVFQENPSNSTNQNQGSGVITTDGETSVETAAPEQQPQAEKTTYNIGEYNVYALQVGAFEDVDNAKALALELQSKGGAGYVWQDNTSYKVFIAAYSSEDDAKNVQSRLETEQQIESKLVTISNHAGSVTLDSQLLSIFSDAVETSSTQLDELLSMSISFDKGALTVEELKQQIKDMISKSQEIKTTLDETVDSSDNVFIERISTFTNDTIEILNDLYSSEESAMASAIKHSLLSLAFSRSDVMNSFLETSQ